MTRQGTEVKGGRGLNVRLKDPLHMEQRMPVLLSVLGRHAIGRDYYVKVAHVRVIGGEQHTNVPGQPGEHDGGHV